MNNSHLDSAVTIARALGHQARLRTLSMLRQGELCVCQITLVLKLAPSTVSAHLRELRRAGLITERKKGRWVWIRLGDDPDVSPWIDTALSAASDDQQMLSDLAFVEEIQDLPVEDLCRLGYEAAREKRDSNVDSTRSRKGITP